MVELDTRHAGDALFLFRDFPHDHTFLEYARHEPGARLFVDDADVPQAVLLCPQTRNLLSFVAGDPGAGCLLLDRALSQPESPPALRFISLPSETWRGTVADHFGARFTESAWVGLMLDPALFAARREERLAAVPEGFTLERIDRDLAARIPRDLSTPFSLFWPDPAAFAAQGLGFCLRQGERIVSIVWSCCPVTTFLEIGAHTHPDFQRRGFVPLVGAVLIEHCLAHGIAPCWTAFAANLPSLSAARKLGFGSEQTHFWIRQE